MKMCLFRGVFWLNIVLAPISIFTSFYFLIWYPPAIVFTDTGFTELILYSFIYALIFAIVQMLLMYPVTWTAWAANSLTRKELNHRRGYLFSIVFWPLFITFAFNAFADEFFQIRQGHYDIVLTEFLLALGYYVTCYSIGVSTKQPKWLF